ncbi:MAG: hypothetical protein KatS3mg131_0541 [Candidatus Tectimicrobiota bacterium]|nr:MAG: hypothetical protein KatS3mg131_0541 [Candidatus Tectomicrobia bacterium]
MAQEAAPGPASPVFYTETLARLYLRQGFVHEALAIYRHLARVHPDQPALQARVAELERRLAAPPTPEAAPARQRATAGVLAELERWLRYVRRLRHKTPPSAP